MEEALRACMGGRREEGSIGAARPAAGLPARSPAARSPSADGGAGPFRNPTPPPTNGDENEKERSKRPRRPWRRFQRVSLGPTGGRGGALYFFFEAWRARAAETEEGGAGETRACVGRPSPPAGRGSGEASDVSTREWNEALPGALRSLRFQGV